MDQSEVKKLVTHIEENLRASGSSGLYFVDSRHHRERLLSRQNHVVFGRRGAGKSSLINSITKVDEHVDISLNLEDFKDITFPNIVIHVLLGTFNQLKEKIKKRTSWYKFWRRKAKKLVDELEKDCKKLEKYIHEPDEEVREINAKEAYQGEASASAKVSALSATGKEKFDSSLEIKRTLARSKLEHLKLELTKYKEKISSISAVLGNKPIFLIMDDLYFVPKDTQPELVDYFHRLTKGTNLFIKVASIKYRSKIYRRAKDRYIGVELGHDIFEIDMDYALDNFEELQSFMRQLLNKAIEQSKARVEIDLLFAGDGFSQLCLASGGVPRDFLSLFVTLANRTSGQPIGKVQVNDVAIANIGSKFDSMKRDSGDEDAVLQECLNHVKSLIYDEKRTNAFLIAKDDLDKNALGRQVIRELVDLRLIHLVDHNTSKAPSDGRRYEAYILDVGLYDNSRPRSFTQVEPGQRDAKARKDDLRASPVIELQKLLEAGSEHPSGMDNQIQESEHKVLPPTKPAATQKISKKPEQLNLELSFE